VRLIGANHSRVGRAYRGTVQTPHCRCAARVL